MTLRGDTRAVSVAVSHSLSIGITTLLITGLIVGSAGLFDDQRERVAEDGLENVGAALMSDIHRLDRFDTSSVDGNLSFESDQPRRLGSVSYDVRLTGDDDGGTLFLTADDVGRSISISFQNESRICESALNGGNLRVQYDASADCLRLQRGGA